MNMTSAVATAYTPSLGRTLTIYGQESRYEFLKLARQRAFSLATIGFPVVFYLLFGVALRHNASPGFDLAKYLLASYCCFGMLGASLFGFGVGIATERGQGWLEVKQASPMPPLAYLSAKLAAAMTFSVIIAILLMVMGTTLADVHLRAGEAVRLLLVVLVGAIPFSSMGMVIGLFAKANSAAGIVNLIYLPLSFCSGLWLPIEALPHFLQKAAPFLPTYHLAQLALHVVHFDRGGSLLQHWTVLAAFTLVCLALASYLFRHHEDRA